MFGQSKPVRAARASSTGSGKLTRGRQQGGHLKVKKRPKRRRSLRQEVRRLASETAQLSPLPAGFELWKKEGTIEPFTWIVRAGAEAWPTLPPELTLHPRQPSLEEVFIACVSQRGITL